jgi:vacuolar-type H+-ATPase subunit D/Vma8
MKGKLKGAQTGHDLLKRKSEALTKYASTLDLDSAPLT